MFRKSNVLNQTFNENCTDFNPLLFGNTERYLLPHNSEADKANVALCSTI